MSHPWGDSQLPLVYGNNHRQVIGVADGHYYETEDVPVGLNMGSSYRGPHTKNKKALLANSSSLWIPPSEYKHNSTENQHTKGTWDFGSAESPVYSAFDGFMSNNEIFIAWKAMEDRAVFIEPYSGYAVWQLNAANRAVTECLLKLKNQKINAGEFMATAMQTANMLVDSVTTLARALLAAKRNQWGAIPGILGIRSSKAKRVSEGVSSRWLEYIYGWKPLMQDVYSSLELLKESMPKALLFRASRQVTSSTETNVGGVIIGGIQGSHRVVERSTSKSKCVIYAQMSAQWKHDLASYGLLNPASVAWELQPYSFVVDWLLPVGNVLSALDATLGLDFVGGYQMQHTRGGGGVFLESLHSYPYHLDVHEVPSFIAFKESYERRVLGGFPLPVLYYKSPFSTTHLANALALLSQLAK